MTIHALKHGRKLLVAAVVVALVAVGASVLRGPGERTYTAYFASADGVYAGDEVRVLGVPVGTIEEIEPTDRGARVVIAVDDGVEIPAEARAAIVSPSLVSSRYVQLAPQYQGGPVLEDGAEIPLSRTAVPVEFDEVKQQLDDLATDFGPRGVNKDGSLSSFVSTSSEVLEGRGQDINDTIVQLERAVAVLDDGSEDIFGTIANLQTFVSVLAASDQQVRELGTRLDVVAEVLADNRQNLRRGLRDLGLAVGDVRRFVEKNGTRLVRTTDGLADVLAVVAGQREALERTLHAGPNALRNLYAAYHRSENSVAVGLQSATTNNLRQLVCGAVGSVGDAGKLGARACVRLLGPLLDAASGDLPVSTSLLRRLEELLGIDGTGLR